MNTRRRRPRFRGKSLLEALVIMSVMSVALGASTTALAALFRVSELIRRDAEAASSLARFAQRLRADAHAAIGCKIADQCVLSLPEGREVAYFRDEKSIAREVRDQGQLVHRDAFPLGSEAEVEFTVDRQSGGELLFVKIRATEPPRLGQLPLPAETIAAAIGIHWAGQEAKP